MTQNKDIPTNVTSYVLMSFVVMNSILRNPMDLCLQFDFKKAQCQAEESVAQHSILATLMLTKCQELSKPDNSGVQMSFFFFF